MSIYLRTETRYQVPVFGIFFIILCSSLSHNKHILTFQFFEKTVKICGYIRKHHLASNIIYKIVKMIGIFKVQWMLFSIKNGSDNPPTETKLPTAVSWKRYFSVPSSNWRHKKVQPKIIKILSKFPINLFYVDTKQVYLKKCFFL